jgi:hypothetical protein
MAARTAVKTADVPKDTPQLFLDIRAARRVSTPLIGIQTTDTSACLSKLIPLISLCHAEKPTDPPVVVPFVGWDLVRGVRVLTKSGEAAKAAMAAAAGDPAALTNPVVMLDAARQTPFGTVLIMENASLVLQDPAVRQGIANLRDLFKGSRRALFLMAPQLRLPAEIEGDVMVFDEPLPNRAAAAAIIADTYEGALQDVPAADVIERAVDAVTGLTAFAIEQNASMSMGEAGIDVDFLQSRRCTVINQTPGLTVLGGKERFENIGGCDNAKNFFTRVVHGQNAPAVVVFIDEIEKSIAGSTGGDLSGTSADQLMQLLTFMQDKHSSGALFIGPPGAAKSVLAKAIGGEAGILTIQFDLGAMKGSLVGQSEERIRTALKVIDAVSAGKALFVGTCNRIATLPPELRRRFKLGTFFFALPDATERAAIWKLYLKKFNIAEQPMPNDTDWTGAEIEQCAELAWSLKTTLVDAATYIVPVAKAAGPQIDALCREANGRFISASHPGVYEYAAAKAVEAPVVGKRQIAVRES